MEAIDALTNRVSGSVLVDPAPDELELHSILSAAVRAPDHGRLRPWRLIVLRGAARKRLDAIDELTLAVENAEQLPFADGAFDVATSVYLFHELPRNARRNVVRELHRVVRRGGLVVIEDSAQLAESSELTDALRGFPKDFHEPFYADYLEDDLAEILRETGFTITSVEPHLVAKVVVASKL